ncbi:uncharacterized protein B0I36DRAFT_1084 [Microdochium trichocladiopsis]|uniref:Uncharacterized protein n=1 Tax=Microdochium trichocladiopsis TaxID=1682393 RepID=A0A9P8YGU3_9PEZI|nr:uncharacterized protein B0I36DRAFT_1084 [Microdochium trichocladiopsis]KAH7039678.1 hypothetical protein B0I36DRAFT_1084 [Microdochium trichocladiopsis]
MVPSARKPSTSLNERQPDGHQGNVMNMEFQQSSTTRVSESLIGSLGQFTTVQTTATQVKDFTSSAGPGSLGLHSGHSHPGRSRVSHLGVRSGTASARVFRPTPEQPRRPRQQGNHKSRGNPPPKIKEGSQLRSRNTVATLGRYRTPPAAARVLSSECLQGRSSWRSGGTPRRRDFPWSQWTIEMIASSWGWWFEKSSSNCSNSGEARERTSHALEPTARAHDLDSPRHKAM